MKLGKKWMLPLVLFAGFAAAAPADAADSPVEGKSRIVFSNGGRIVTIKADGTGRKVLTRKGKVTGRDRKLFSEGEKSDRFPELSPDGKKVLFFRQTDFGRYTEESTNSDFYIDGQPMVVPVKGGRAHRVLGPEKQNHILRDATWIPGSRNFLAVSRSFSFFNLKARNSVVVVSPKGKILRSILTLKEPRRYTRKARYYLATQLAVSPDGSKFLMTMQDDASDTESRLALVDMKTGKRRQVRDQAREGSWSRDGSRFTFVSVGSGPENCEESPYDCRTPYDVFTADADGSHVRRVKATSYDERTPSFSPDGQAIAFTANRNRPAIQESREVYRMKTDGSCLDWLTNGSPASTESDWGPGSTTSTECGPTDRTPLVEGNPGRLDIPRWGPRYWLGKSYDGALMSGSLSFLGISLVDYRDCGTFRRADCPKPAIVAQAPVCLVGDLLPAALQILNNRKLRLRSGKARGVRFRTGYFKGFSTSLTFTGGTILATVQQSGGRRSGRIDQLGLINSLRVLGHDAGGRLPVFRVPVSALQEYRKAKRAVRKFGRREAARRLDMSRWELKANLRFRANLRRVGPARTIGCGGFGGIGDLFDEGARAGAPQMARALLDPTVDAVRRSLPSFEVPEYLKRTLVP